MSRARDRGRLAGFVRRFWWALVLLVVAVLAASVVAIWHATHVRWAEVMAAVAKQKTINGVGRIYAEDGSEWALALWIRSGGSASYAANWMLVPSKGSRKRAPTPDVDMLREATDYTDGIGAIGPLAENHSATRVSPTEWGGEPALEAVVSYPAQYLSGWRTHPDGYRFYLDPDTRLVMAAELFMAGKLRATVEYHYNRPLPKGFEAP